jgi:superfamily I DNA and/or RNA helicase
MYKGQLAALRRELQFVGNQQTVLSGQLQRIRADTVDNFQGEESDIIILSLVRNNKDGILGFTKNINRVCVALSRAKHGMYIFGNASILSNEDCWKDILGKLGEAGGTVSSLKLVCTKHHTKETIVRALRITIL